MKYLTLIHSVFIISLSITSLQSHAVKPFVITCGDGKTIEVSDSQYTPKKSNDLCLHAGHPEPRQIKPTRNLSTTPTNTLSSKKDDGVKMGLLLPAVQKAVCGSSSSISAALDQCGKQGHTFAHCIKKSGNWTCTPKKDQSGPNTRSTNLNSNP